ncbi:hypothetical protein SAMN05216419_100744 [Nitrosomonas cryotolerans]|nr:hypothetical protein SAMN05216419_100744 [Nitrosomonas cryotolerans]
MDNRLRETFAKALASSFQLLGFCKGLLDIVRS